MIWKVITGRAILIRPASGLGNQLFLYCAGLFAAENTGKELFIDVSRLKSEEVSHGGTIESFNLKGNFVSLKTTGRILSFVLPRISHIKPVARLLGIYVADNVGFQSALEVNQRKLRYIEGFFMCDDYVNSLTLKGILGELVLKNPSFNFKALSDSFPQRAILVHVRRGDFLANPNAWGILSEDYYLSAIELIELQLKQEFQIVVISDNITLVKNEFKSPKWRNSIFLNTTEFDPAEIMSLFSQADAIVIGNSTFSWWGSLNSKAPVIIAPQPFYKGSPEFNDLDRDDLIFIESVWIN